jgi:hypothetical protein
LGCPAKPAQQAAKNPKKVGKATPVGMHTRRDPY